jgi:hypothetical protein
MATEDTGLEIIIHFCFQLFVLECRLDIRQNARCLTDFRQQVNLQVWCKRIRKAHVSGKSTEDKIAHLDARGWNDITETEVMVTQKLWKVM